MGIFKLSLPRTALAISLSFVGGVEVAKRDGELELAKTFYVEAECLSYEGDRPDRVDKEKLRGVISQLLENWEGSLTKISLVLPDNLFRIIIMNGLTELPKRKDELTSLIRWLAERKFSIPQGESYLDYQRLPENRFLVAGTPKALIDQMVEVLSSLSLHPGWIIPESFGLMNYIHHLLPCSKDEDMMLVNIGDRYLSFAIFQEDDLLLFRRRGITSYRKEELIRELSSTILYYQENLNPRERLRVFVGGRNSLTLHPIVREALSQEVVLLASSASFSSAGEVEVTPLLGAIGAALEGVLG